MSRIAHRYDESSAKVRANRRGTRPRSKRRPDHADAESGTVRIVDRGRFTVAMDDDQRDVMAMRARELGRQSLVVGDQVGLVGDTTAKDGSLARIVRIEDRRNTLRRTADDTDPAERVIVANVDVLVIVTATADPQPRPGMIDRCLVAAHDADVAPVLCLTKTDLCAGNELAQWYGQRGVDVVGTSVTSGDEGLAELRDLLSDRRSVLLGHSGVGKSTLVNALVPHAGRATGSVNQVTGRGRHTSSSAVMLPLPQGGWIIDTPGVRSFGLAHVDAEGLVAGFTELAPLTAACAKGCTHLETTCSLEALARGGTDAERSRVHSLRTLLENRSGGFSA